MKKNITLPHNWAPRDYQMPLWNQLGSSKVNRFVSCWHRRAGKDDVYLHHNACAAFERVGNYWYLLPEYNQCRKAVWDAINPHTGKKRIDEAFPPEIRANTLNQEMKIIFPNGSSWQLMGSDNFDSLVGAPPVGLTFSEYALSNPSAWGFLRPILLENGGWAAFNSTPRGKNHFHKILKLAQEEKDWYGEVLTADQTNVFSREQLQAELKELQSEHGETYGKAIWLQEYFCSFEAALPGSIWGEAIASIEAANHVGDVPHTIGYPVFTAWDLGRSDFTSVWFYQVIAGEIRVIDFYQDSFKEIPDYAAVIKQKSKELGYEYGIHWMPHDAFPKRLGMGGKSMMQQFIAEDIGQIGKVPDMGRDKGIQAARTTFKRCFFDRAKTGQGLEHLKNYRRKYDEVNKTFSTEPVHDENSHASDAWRYLSLSWRESINKSPELTQQQKFSKGNITQVNFGQLKEQHFKRMRAQRESY